MSIFQPSNQIKLTNVSVVRLKKRGKPFEVACYKNKVMEWRNNIETDLDEVLQIHSIFKNVSKGQVASKNDLKSFRREDSENDRKSYQMDEDEIIREILKEGKLQVSERERIHQLDNIRRDIVTIVAEKCVNPETKRPYTITMIESAMEDLHLSVNPSRSAKQQALEVIKQLQERQIIPIARAQMRIMIVLPSKDAKQIKKSLTPLISSVEKEDWTDGFDMVCLIDPGQYRVINDLIQAATRGRGHVELLNLNEMAEEDEKLE